MNQHQTEINSQDYSHTMFGQRQVSTAVEDVGCKTTDEKFDGEKRDVSVGHNARHQRIAFAGNIEPDPKNRQFGIEPIQDE